MAKRPHRQHQPAILDQTVLDQLVSILWDPDTNDWRELRSCADAIQDISLVLAAYMPNRKPAPKVVVRPTLRQDNARHEAKHLLRHYFRMFAGGTRWHPDNDAETDCIVDLIIEAAGPAR